MQEISLLHSQQTLTNFISRGSMTLFVTGHLSLVIRPSFHAWAVGIGKL